MKDGLYRVDKYGICAGFIIKDGRVTHYAPILWKRLSYWMTIAVLISGCAPVTITWHEVDSAELPFICRTADTRGCYVEGTSTGDYIYVVKRAP